MWACPMEATAASPASGVTLPDCTVAFSAQQLSLIWSHVALT